MMRKLIVGSMVLGLSRALVVGHASHARLLSLRAGSMPENEEMKVFYALGVNVAKQVGGEIKVTLIIN
jgi:hypothetical protein